MTLTGTVVHHAADEEFVGGEVCMHEIDPASQDRLPRMRGDTRVLWFCFTNTEEEAVGLTTIVPFLVEDELRRNGGVFSKAGDWQPYVVWDGSLITGQNPASSGTTAERLKSYLDNR